DLIGIDSNEFLAVYGCLSQTLDFYIVRAIDDPSLTLICSVLFIVSSDLLIVHLSLIGDFLEFITARERVCRFLARTIYILKYAILYRLLSRTDTKDLKDSLLLQNLLRCVWDIINLFRLNEAKHNRTHIAMFTVIAVDLHNTSLFHTNLTLPDPNVWGLTRRYKLMRTFLNFLNEVSLFHYQLVVRLVNWLDFVIVSINDWTIFSTTFKIGIAHH
ncbi:hypothetical protein ACJX0J_013595, partial [Zea mays]